MRTRLTWISAILVLVSIGFLMACSTKYSSSSNGLVVIPSQGSGVSGVMESFSIDLANGHSSEINNVNGPITNGIPGPIVLDPAGAFAYVIIYENPGVLGSETGIESFAIASDGKLATGTMNTLSNASVQVQVNGATKPQAESVPVVPVALTIDSVGKFLFVANSATSDSSVPSNPVPGSVSVFAIGNNGSLTEVPSSPFVLPVNGANVTPPNPCVVSVACPDPLALAVSSTVYPLEYGYCSGFTPPTAEYLYVPDSTGYLLLNYSVSSTGTLKLQEPEPGVPGVPTGTMPDGVAVDPCNRFVYVSNGGPGNSGNSISAYTICSTVNVVSQPDCPTPPDFRPLQVKGSPFPVSPGDFPGPMTVDAYGNFLYVVDTALGQGQVSAFKIGSATGALTPLTPANVAAGVGANSIAIRNDDSWMFVANITSATISQYAITPSTGELTPQLPPIITFNLPSGVAVK
jgi:6-phosphogluconolactonase (cycloisomerase 2 family)